MAEDYRHFPHPVLSNDRDDYIDSSFSNNLIIDHIADKLVFRFNSLLDNEDILRLINNKKASLIYRIESSQTMYREVFMVDFGENKIYIDESDLKGKIVVETYIVALENIYKFKSCKFHSDYKGLVFNLLRSDIIAIGEKFNFRLDKDMEELYNIPSIFLISRVDDENMDMRVSFEGEKINIILNNEDYVSQQNLSTNPVYQPILHAMIIMPALIYLFTDLQDADDLRFEELSEKRWFKSIDGILRKMNLALESYYIRQESPYRLAQLILDNPLNRALKSLSIKDEVE